MARQPSQVDIGSYRKQLQLQALPTPQAKDVNWNEPTYGDWATLGTVWGSIEPLSGRELVFAAQIVADATHMIKIRYYQGLTPRMRFGYQDDVTGKTRIFNVEYVKDVDERHVEHQCLCREAQA